MDKLATAAVCDIAGIPTIRTALIAAALGAPLPNSSRTTMSRPDQFRLPRCYFPYGLKPAEDAGHGEHLSGHEKVSLFHLPEV